MRASPRARGQLQLTAGVHVTAALGQVRTHVAQVEA
jgi:hypothetical protein